MPFSELMYCSEFRQLIQRILDGADISESYRRGIRAHRESCATCCEFHDRLLHLTAVSQETVPPREYNPANYSNLWNKILDAVGVHPGEVQANPEIVQAVGSPPLVHASTATPVQPAAVPSAGSSDRHRVSLQINSRELDVVFKQAPQKSLPVGRLDASKIDKDEGEGSGKITDLAKFLLGPDESKLHKLIDREQAHLRVNRLRDSSYETLKKLQDFVLGQSIVAASLVIAPDGTIISRRQNSTNPDEDEVLSVWATVAYHNAQAACPVLGHSRVTQLVSRTDCGFVIVAKVQDLMLVILVDGTEDDAYKVVARIRSLNQ